MRLHRATDFGYFFPPLVQEVTLLGFLRRCVAQARDYCTSNRLLLALASPSEDERYLALAKNHADLERLLYQRQYGDIDI